jgi:hypothetical protein
MKYIEFEYLIEYIILFVFLSAYIVFGISAYFNIYINKGLFVTDEDTSNRLCWLTALIRNLIAYADFLTLAFIAYVR